MLCLENVHVRKGPATLLGGVSLGVAPGEVVAVAGPNGAGKSTLLRVMAGEEAPSEGRVVLDGQALPAPEPLARRRAVLPQQSALGFGFTAFEVAALGRTPHARHASRAEDEAATWRALGLAGVDGLAARRYPTLSGGEAQRVHLARALAQLDAPPEGPPAGDGLPPAPPPRFLLLDEPTASLDLQHQHAVLAAARALAAEGVGVLVVLHDLNLAAQYATRIVLLCEGRVLAAGPPTETLTPALVRAAFGVGVLVVPHPCLACPLVVPVPEGAAGAGGGLTEREGHPPRPSRPALRTPDPG